MMKGKDTTTFKGARGTKGIVSTGKDSSSMGGTGSESLKGNLKGDRHNLGHSIEGAKSSKGN